MNTIHSRLRGKAVAFALAGLASVAALGSAGFANAQELERLSLRLDWLPSGYHAPIFLAIDKGYYREAGIDLTLEDGQGSNAALQAVAAGTNDVVIANYTTMLQSIAQGMDLIAIGGLIQRLPDSIVSLERNPVLTPQDLEGRTVSTPPDSAASKLFPAFLDAAGVDASKVNILNTASGQSIPAVLGGSAQATTGWSFTDALVVARQAPIAPPILFSDFGINLLGNGFVTTQSFAAENGDLLSKFMEATARGYEEGLADPTAAVQALAAARPLVDVELQSQQLAAFPPFLHSANSEGQPFGWTAEADWEQTAQLLRDYFDLQGEVDISSVYTNDFVPQQ
ncbi:ABC transporter substrate-binding protein [Pelagibacterium lacus]|uniref:Thiamine pyrimidine synthase n=1 Tax=Pelagibacterium lacus TaxID=2282655 RepID=A0A369W6S4_9HYPH|nr:ABC transporter substrate-binding protein [Pelagibacterium lacus]RDE09555.1 hypothetical protein DVH29_05180 [Pelagibacterium lacus]